MSVKNALTIEIVYLTPTHQTSFTLNLPENSSILDAINCSHILTKHPEIDLQKSAGAGFCRETTPEGQFAGSKLQKNKVGIFGKSGHF